MRFYFVGIGGSGIAAMAHLALDAGFEVVGSDLSTNQNTQRLKERGVNISTDQSGDFMRYLHQQKPIDQVIYTSALPADHPELLTAKELGLNPIKRDKFIPWFIQKHNFKLIAVAGAHGKTSTTTMLIWLFRQLGVPASYLVGSNLAFGEAGHFDPDSQYFIYECDEYDRNFLQYYPAFSLIPAIDYDHIDIYPTIDDYRQAFAQFFEQSQQIFLWQKDLWPGFQPTAKFHFAPSINPDLKILGQHNRANAQLILELLPFLNDARFELTKAIKILNNSPRAGRRFELIQNNLISDYAHHPSEIKATLELAEEYAQLHDFKQIIAVYEPHQNERQIQFQAQYPAAFTKADQVLWLPTFVARDHHDQILPIKTLIRDIPQAEPANFNQALINTIQANLRQNNLVILMSAGNLDSFVRHNLTFSQNQ